MFNLNLFQKSKSIKIEKFNVCCEIKLERYEWKFNSFNFSENFKLTIANFLRYKFNKKRQFLKNLNPESKSVLEGFFLKKKIFHYNSKNSSIALIKTKLQPKRVFVFNIKNILIKNLKIKKILNFLFLKYHTSIFSTQKRILFSFKYYHTKNKKRRPYTSIIKKNLLSKYFQQK